MSSFAAAAAAAVTGTGTTTTTTSRPLLLDSEIRNWVLFPIIALTLLLGLARHYITAALGSTPSPKMKTAANASTALLARKLMENGSHLSPEGYRGRVELLCGAPGSSSSSNPSNAVTSGEAPGAVAKNQQQQHQGLLRRKVDPIAMDQLMDQGMMGEMMKGNVVNMAPNVGMMSLMGSFFSGFIVAKTPFAVPSTFRPMLQRGVDMEDLDVSYATSLSVYFMIMFGVQPVLNLLIGAEAQGGDAAMAKAQMGQGQQPNQPVDYSKVFPQLAEELQFNADHYKWSLESAPEILIENSS